MVRLSFDSKHWDRKQNGRVWFLPWKLNKKKSQILLPFEWHCVEIKYMISHGSVPRIELSRVDWKKRIISAWFQFVLKFQEVYQGILNSEGHVIYQVKPHSISCMIFLHTLSLTGQQHFIFCTTFSLKNDISISASCIDALSQIDTSHITFSSTWVLWVIFQYSRDSILQLLQANYYYAIDIIDKS